MRRPSVPRTMHGRLVAVLALVLTFGLAVAAALTVLFVQHVLVAGLDERLHAAGDRYAVSLEHDDHDADNDADDGDSRYGQVEGQEAGTLGARLFHGAVTDAAIVGDNNTSGQVPTAARARLTRFTAPTGPTWLRLPDVGEYRVVVTAGRDGDLQVTGLPAAPIRHTVHVLGAVVIAVFAVTLLVVALASAGLIRVMLRPLSRMSRTATDVAALPLGSGGVSLPHRVETASGGSEVDALARAFNAMLEQVESALRTRADSEDRLRRFIADASHELRTPVAVVRSHADLARRVGGGTVPDEVERSLDRIAAHSERMGHLVEDLLLLARLDSGRALAQERVDVVRIVLDAVDDARIAFDDHRWRLALPDHAVHVIGDPHALGEAVANLLTNAAAHTPAGTTTTVGLREDGDTVEVSVRDDGPGMSADVAGRAFDRFVRGDTERAMTRGSSGLGLPIVAAIVTAHGGTVGLDTSGSGTTVRFRLPADQVGRSNPPC